MRNSIRFPFLFLCIICLKTNIYAQIEVPGAGPQTVLNGYAGSLQGEVWPYFSVYPDYARTALLTRCTDGQKFIEWETAPVPENTAGPYVYFSWIAAHSTGTSKGIRHFDLWINERRVLTFSTYPNAYPAIWSFAGADSTRLSFEFKTRDAAADAHGIAYLRVPAQYCKPGAPLRLKVAGQAQNSTDWYMTFQYSFEEKMEVEPLPFLLRGAAAQQAVLLKVLHFGPPDTLKVLVKNQFEYSFPVRNGVQSCVITGVTVSAPVSISIEARIGRQFNLSRSVVLKPVRYREIDLIHHSHTDIGYSHYQEDVAAIHSENIRQAMHMIEKTASYPEGSRFVWHVESLWAVENFLRTAKPDEIQRFVRAAHRGQIVLSGAYANILTGLCSPEELRWWTEYADTLRTRYKLAIRTAMFSDIPGLNWPAVTALAWGGIRYLSNGPNYGEALPDKGDRIGSTLRAQGDRPFWWKSPTGQDSILVWTCGRGYSSWHGTPIGGVAQRGAQKIAAYLNELEADHYPYDMVQWRYNIVSDNGPIDTTISDFVRDWNERYVSPQLVLANVNDVFECFESQYGKKIPSWSGDFTPYWEDGAYSTAAEEAEARLLSNRLTQLRHLADQKRAVLPSSWWYQARRHILLFHEHTWGAWCSISQPDDPFTTRQWAYKKRLLDSARHDVGRIENALIPVSATNNKILVVNTLPWGRSAAVEISWPKHLRAHALEDDQGNLVPLQKLANGNRIFIARDIPANGSRTYKPAVPGAKAPDTKFQNFQSWAADPETGAVAALTMRDREWVDGFRYGGLMQAIYVNGLNPDSFSRSVLVNRQAAEQGAVLRRTRQFATLAGTYGVVYEVSQYNGLPVLHLALEIDKRAVRDKEAIHVAFPFALGGVTTRIGTGDEWFFKPESGQIPGSNKDFFSVQRWIDLSNQNFGVTLSCPQGALFEIGKPIDERRLNHGYKTWKTGVENSPTIFLYALNNYWHTNYKADQNGRVRFDFYLHFHTTFNAGMSDRWGKEAVEPLIGIWE